MEPQEIIVKYQDIQRQFHDGQIDRETFESGLLEIKRVRAAMKAGWDAAGEDTSGVPDTQELLRVLDQKPPRMGNTSGTRRPVFQLGALPGTARNPSDTHTAGLDVHAPGSEPQDVRQSGVFHRGLDTQSLRLQPGEILGECYTLERSLGHGTLGDCWRAYNRSTDRSVVIKLLPHELHQDTAFLASIHGTFRSVASLRGNHIRPLYRVALDDEFGLYFVSAFLDAVPLNEYHAEYLKTFGAFPVNAILRVLWPVAISLDLAHARSIVHRGLKMQNILIGRRCGVQVTDFTIPEMLRRALKDQRGESQNLEEEMPFQAPEIHDERRHSPRSDQYALGVVAYRLLSGRFPFFAKTEKELQAKIQEESVPGIDAQPENVNDVFARVLARNPQDRFESCLHFLKELAEPSARGPYFIRSGGFVSRGTKFGLLPLLLGVGYPKPPKSVAEDRTSLWPFPEKKQEPGASSVVKHPNAADGTPERTPSVSERSHNNDLFNGHSYPYRNITTRTWLGLGALASIAVAVGTLALFFDRIPGVPRAGTNHPSGVGPGVASVRPANEGRISNGNPSGNTPGNASTLRRSNPLSSRIAVGGAPDPGNTVQSVFTENAALTENPAFGASPSEPIVLPDDTDFLDEMSKLQGPSAASMLQRLQGEAERGSPEAKRKLGEMYLLGKGVVKNEDTAFQWFRDAAEAGDAFSFFQVGRCYEFGVGTRKNPRTAVQWYLRGAAQNEPMSFYRLGLCYEHGVGVEASAIKAVDAFQKAAALDHREAKRKLEP
ncbi:MAG TPA: hypothetical protein DEB39_08235 [Planctomycetaceae bacterium]|nr:hypothetical protein [Planctomycetaceae bacterium]